MPFPKKNAISRRTSFHISSTLVIESIALPSEVSCVRYSYKGLNCFCVVDGRYSEYIRSSVEKGCLAKMALRTLKSLAK